MLRISLCLLLAAVFASATFAQQRRVDVQSLEYEFGSGAKVETPPPDPVIPPKPPSIVQNPPHSPRPSVTVPPPCGKPVVYAPVERPYCVPVCPPVYTQVCPPVYASYYPVPVRPAYCPPYVQRVPMKKRCR